MNVSNPSLPAEHRRTQLSVPSKKRNRDNLLPTTTSENVPNLVLSKTVKLAQNGKNNRENTQKNDMAHPTMPRKTTQILRL